MKLQDNLRYDIYSINKRKKCGVTRWGDAAFEALEQTINIVHSRRLKIQDCKNVI